MKRILLAAVLGGVAIFIWGFLSHAVLPLGQTGIKVFPDEETMMMSMQSTLTAPGFYFFPGMDPSQQNNPAAMKAWEDKYKAGPRGVLIYQPSGAQPMSPTQLAMELFTNLLAAFIAAYLLSKTGAPFIRIVWLSMLLGVFAWAVVNVPYWNWYGFPGDFTAAAVLQHAVGWTLGGIAMGWVLKPKPAMKHA